MNLDGTNILGSRSTIRRTRAWICRRMEDDDLEEARGWQLQCDRALHGEPGWKQSEALTHFGTIAGYARYSPDGSKIVFMMRLPSLAYEIFVMNANGDNVKQLTSMNRERPCQRGRPMDRRSRSRQTTSRGSRAFGP